jgi:class 3 adenylate cyclase
LEVRIGIHTGEVEIVGDDVRGAAVHEAARIAADTGAGEILVSSTPINLPSSSGFEFVHGGT